jgi:hypothetical protein
MGLSLMNRLRFAFFKCTFRIYGTLFKISPCALYTSPLPSQDYWDLSICHRHGPRSKHRSFFLKFNCCYGNMFVCEAVAAVVYLHMPSNGSICHSIMKITVSCLLESEAAKRTPASTQLDSNSCRCKRS